ncbi:MAG: ERF family protein [Armatimonadia bacterium]|nr:ERF family protein [Betaproteobacteria bacterium]
MNTAVAQTVDQLPVAPYASESAAILNVIERMAMNSEIDPDRIERFIDLKERMDRTAAEKQFNAAMSEAQREMGVVAVNATNTQTRSQYATYDKLDRALRPIYTKHGFALSFDEGQTDKPDYIRIMCIVSHTGGFSRTYHRDMPADGKGAKGGDVMTKTHAAGAAASYGMRYLLRGIFNVAVGLDDKDGNSTGDARAINEQQRQTLSDLIDQTGADEAKFFAFFAIEYLAELPASRFAEAKRMLEAKRK